ncbi:MAG: cellulose biosynthesis protein BcsD [Hafnia alvei]|jgi:hypothetical protein|uniref:cellulose biosynthesis protein BcsD n=1 Tax=Hafnia alvei TaxID=569 RepID=UPI000693B98D|nr:cellulose biosynthesis protein BcsD [Hafnia alvei]MDN5985877.1 cellulose synthase [Hafniaceae bacterium]NEY30461.1 cellulose synthase [Escherichia coli]ANC39466.1 hypothetical protein A6V27_03355 [Hafnia alvei]MBI0278290.1 cellulose synthase [Hafnia alvei]MCE9871289.1 cellulose synthase [Hafnia alvei]
MTNLTINPALRKYHRQQQYVAGWQDLSALFFSGILQTAESEDGRAFLHMIGANLARRFPLGDVQTLGELEDGANAVLSHFGWGIVNIDADEQGINLRHQAWPYATEADDPELWLAGFSAVLEGCWTTWMQTQGAMSEFVTFLTYGGENALNFRCQYKDKE